MSRAWRIEFDVALYHVLSRENEQGEILLIMEKLGMPLALFIHQSAKAPLALVN